MRFTKDSTKTVEDTDTSTLMPIVITGINGAVKQDTALTRVTCYEETNIIVTGTLTIPDERFSLPVKREDGRIYLFLAEVISGAFTVVLNFPVSGTFTYSNAEANKNFPEPIFSVETLTFDVLRKV